MYKPKKFFEHAEAIPINAMMQAGDDQIAGMMLMNSLDVAMRRVSEAMEHEGYTPDPDSAPMLRIIFQSKAVPK